MDELDLVLDGMIVESFRIRGVVGTYRVDWVDVEVLAAEVGRRSRSNDDLDLLFGGHFIQ
jgi:hypothetical protein